MRRYTVLAAIALAVALVLALALPLTAQQRSKRTYPADKGPATIDVSKFAPAEQNNYRIFATKCSTCHTLARAINTNKTALAWKMYIERMQKKPNSGIDDFAAPKVYQFLKFYQEHKNAQKKDKPKP